MASRKRTYTEIKKCVYCGHYFGRHPKSSLKQWEERRYCDRWCGAWQRGKTKETDQRLANMGKAISERQRGRPTWNTGKTKDTDPRVARNGEKVSEANQGRPVVGRMAEGLEVGRKWCKGKTKEEDPRLAARGEATGEALRGRSRPDHSERLKRYYESNPQEHPNYKLAKKSKGNGFTYIERLVSEYLEELGIASEFNRRIGTKWVDFAIMNFGLVVEADGERWHQDEEAEAARDEYLCSMGWQVLHLTGSEIVNAPDSCKARIMDSIGDWKEIQ